MFVEQGMIRLTNYALEVQAGPAAAQLVRAHCGAGRRSGQLPLTARSVLVIRKPPLRLAAELVPFRASLEWNFKQSSLPALADRSGLATAEHKTALMPASACPTLQ